MILCHSTSSKHAQDYFQFENITNDGTKNIGIHIRVDSFTALYFSNLKLFKEIAEWKKKKKTKLPDGFSKWLHRFPPPPAPCECSTYSIPPSALGSQWHAAGSCRDTWVTTAASCSRTDGKQDLLGPTPPGPPGKTDLSGSEEAELRRLE